MSIKVAFIDKLNQIFSGTVSEAPPNNWEPDVTEVTDDVLLAACLFVQKNGGTVDVNTPAGRPRFVITVERAPGRPLVGSGTHVEKT